MLLFSSWKRWNLSWLNSDWLELGKFTGLVPWSRNTVAVVTGEDGCRGLAPFVWEVDSADTDAKISERADQQ